MNNETLKPIAITELETTFQNFVEFKRSTGLKYISEERTIRYFIRYCNSHYPKGNLPEGAIFDWINEFGNQSQKTKCNYVGVMTGWAKYMFSLGYTQMRIPTIHYSKNTAFIPHIFTQDELNAIWNTVDSIKPTKVYPNLHRCVPVLFRLLYSCGLRISEALAITTNDINFDTSVIILRQTKLDRERLIPLSESIAKTIKNYVDGQCEENTPNSPIFYYRKGNPLTASTVYGRFRLTLTQSKIPYEGRCRGPRLHDFRHTFAVTTMNQLCDKGNDIYVTLPILSAYLGHANIKSTERYIRLTEDRLMTVTDSMQSHFSKMFPEVNDNEEF